MLRNNVLTLFFELAGDRRPRVVRFDERTARISERLPSSGVAEQPDHRVREIVWCVGRQEVAARFEWCGPQGLLTDEDGSVAERIECPQPLK